MAKGDVSSALETLIPKLCETDVLQEPTEEFIRLEDKLRTCINNFGSIILTYGQFIGIVVAMLFFVAHNG